MKLVYTQSGKEVKVGDVVPDFRGDMQEVTFFRPPHKSTASGKVSVKEPGTDNMSNEYYVSVIGAEWILREDRQEDPEPETITVGGFFGDKKVTREEFVDQWVAHARELRNLSWDNDWLSETGKINVLVEHKAGQVFDSKLKETK